MIYVCCVFLFYCLFFIWCLERNACTSQSEEEGTWVSSFALYAPWKSDTFDWSKSRTLVHTSLLVHVTALTQHSSPLLVSLSLSTLKSSGPLRLLISCCRDQPILSLTKHARQVCGLDGRRGAWTWGLSQRSSFLLRLRRAHRVPDLVSVRSKGGSTSASGTPISVAPGFYQRACHTGGYRLLR